MDGTPRPVPRGEVHQDVVKRFYGVTVYQITEADPKGDDLTQFLHGFDFVEPYDPMKAYSRRPFFRVYEKTLFEYKNHLICITDLNGVEQYFVVAKRLPFPFAAALKNCPCIRCRFPIVTWVLPCYCSICVGCLSAGPEFADKGKIRIAEAGGRPEWKLKLKIGLGLCITGFVYLVSRFLF